LLGGGGLLGADEPGVVLLGVVLLPGGQGFATVVEVPPGPEADAVVVADPVVELVELPVPLFAVAEVFPVVGVPLAVVEVPVLLDGVHGTTVVDVPVVVEPCVPPVTDPALPATPGVPGVVAGLPLVVLPGWVVCNVPIELDPVVEVVPVWVDVVPGCVLVVPCEVLVVGALGVTVPVLDVPAPVLCAVARPTDNANTDVANKILRIESCSL
jgi:hypothetical protein